tara:strand:+ start:284 stop:817 length:534 start_codon:yes stop_codon:yes gene_type:complete
MSELMAMLAPGAPPMDSVRSTGLGRLTSQDIAACLTGLDRLTYLYSLSKFALDNNSRAELNALAVKEAIQCGFKLNKEETNRTVAVLALAALEVAINPYKCKRCKGVGEIKLMSKVEICGACNGLGNRTVSERNLAKILGVTLFQSRKVWKKRFALLQSKHSERDETINHIIFNRLR